MLNTPRISAPLAAALTLTITGIAAADPIDELGPYHLPMTDFPIALLYAAIVAETLAMLTQQQRFREASRFCVVLTAVTAPAAALLGWFYAGFEFVDTFSSVMTAHRWMGTMMALWAVALAMIQNQKNLRPLFLVMLYTGGALMAVTGYIGGYMAH